QKATKSLTALKQDSGSDSGSNNITIHGSVQGSFVGIGSGNTFNMGSSGVSATQREQIYNSPLIVMARGANLTVSYDPDIKRVISILPRTGAPTLEDGYTGVVDLGNMNNARYDINLSNNSSLIVIGLSNQISFYNDTNPAGKVNVTTIGTNNLIHATGYESQVKQFN
ncbi:MAG: hypothetical protein NDI94_06660, partial [Candidatus Woesearchaeota archaeon]|nr:hypothetical protein [Candidatus Woesearchaeota archaeon]